MVTQDEDEMPLGNNLLEKLQRLFRNRFKKDFKKDYYIVDS